MTFHRQGKLEAAEALLTQTQQALLESLGPFDPRTLEVTTSLGLVSLEREKPDLAQQMLTDALARAQQTLGADHPLTAIVKLNLFELLYRQGRKEEGRKLLEEVIELGTRILGRRHPDTLRSMVRLGCFLRPVGNLATMPSGCFPRRLRGVAAHWIAITRRPKPPWPGWPNIYAQKKDMKQLGRVLIEATEISRHRWGSDDARTAQAAFTTGMFLLLQARIRHGRALSSRVPRVHRQGPPRQPRLLVERAESWSVPGRSEEVW